MLANIAAIFAASAAVVSAAAVPHLNARGQSGSVSVTPHVQYSSSIGVLGCKINTDRVAYWPGSVHCDDICVKVSHGGRSLHLLRIDSSGGAYDVSYDAWNYLAHGASARDDPHMGGGVDMHFEYVDPSECADLLDHGKLPLSAANSMNYVASCLGNGSWAGRNHVLYNIANPTCTIGRDERCSLDLATSNQPNCPSGLGTGGILKGHEVENIEYGTGKVTIAL
ncbi:hypothetical protein SODALDRAFT_178904 [Sodiomyces alkalinus F11]|uniref:Cerato-platanin n=1 Tax=Sodiomyces alkalinus (strain CBS 110278 / VKM F-3762 / F11) TaxID=1314773 RepID=A0A3N2PU25_SODAK|nr:hypothetical protein SODALDRAFT_178904 [Sodiomyces alkalinus F11]ROT37999.1 hypothetical protein SODALDRAFT_178904 [Sodiomyces alkalinus F11]